MAVLGLASGLIGIALFVLALGAFDQTYYRLRVEAHDATTGEVRWVIDEGTNEFPHFTDELLLLADGDGTAAVDATGEVLWRIEGIRSRPRIAGGERIYFVQSGEEVPPSVVAVDADSGRVLWRAEDRWLERAGDRYAVLRYGDVDEIVEAASGSVVHTTENLRDTLIGGGIVAYQSGRTLHALRPAEGLAVENSDRRRRPLAIVDPIVVAEHYGERDEGTGQRPWTLIGIDSRTGEVQWETTFTRPSRLVSQDGNVLQFARAGLVTEIDATTGEAEEREPVPSADALRWPKAGYAGSVVVDQFVRVDAGSGDVMVLTAHIDDANSAWATIAADVKTRRVIWTMSGPQPVAANSEVTVLHVDRSFQLFDSETGSMLMTVPAAKKFARAVATDRWAVVVSDDELIAVDGTGRARIVADRLTPSSRIEAAIGDIVVLHERRGQYPSGRRTLTAYHVATGEQLWEHSSVSWRGSVRLAGDNLELVHGDGVTEIVLASGEMTQRTTSVGDTVEEPSNQLVAAFDAALSRLLWSADLERTERVAVIGDAVLIYSAERSPVERFVPDDWD
jgi:outer membrane protein assembly factor BamB